MRSKSVVLAFVCAAWLSAQQAQAAVVYSLNMTGAQEVGAGDPDGFGSGLLVLDAAAVTMSWNFTYSNIAAPNGMHIHGPGGVAGVNAGVFVGLGVSTTGGPGTLVGTLLSPSVTLAQINQINANPSEFYVNIHNAEFPGGAIRGQLVVVPEPTSLSLLGLLGVGVFMRSRRR